jgi:hypothetical protein
MLLMSCHCRYPFLGVLLRAEKCCRGDKIQEADNRYLKGASDTGFG